MIRPDCSVVQPALHQLKADKPQITVCLPCHLLRQFPDRRYPRMEALVSHSRLDDVVPFECGRALAERWAGQGARVRLSVNLAPTHAAAALTSYGTAFSFLNGRFAGRPMRANTSRYLHSLVEEPALQSIDPTAGADQP